MDQKLALLSAVYVLDKNQVQLSENTMRHLRIILSQFTEEVISEDEYQELVSFLKDEGFITRHNDKILITPAGSALVHAISERIMGQTAITRLEDILGDYRKNPSQYIQAISERLSQFHETREEKAKPADKSQIRVVGLLLEIRHKVPELFLHSFKLDPRLMRNNEEGIDKEINYQTRRFIETQKTPILSYREEDTLRVTGLFRITGFTLFGQHLTPSVVEAVKPEQVSGWNLLLATTFLESKLAELGYLRARWPGRTFIKYREFKAISTNVGDLRESEGINVDYQELEDSHVFVWIETFTSPNKRVLDFIRERVSNISNEQEILDCLRGLKLKIIPSGTEVELNGVLPDTNLTQKHG